MNGLPRELYQDLRQVLLACGPFGDPAGLRAVFDVAELYAWRNSVPADGDKQSRVDATITLLYNNPYEPINPLVRFLQVLANRAESAGCRRELTRLAGEITKHLAAEGVASDPTGMETPATTAPKTCS